MEKNRLREELISHSPVKLVDEVILRAYSDKASDIHIEPGDGECRVRIRIDGDLVQIGRYKKEIHEEAVARLKVLASLRTDVRNAPQDGRFKVNIGGTGVNIRLSIIPTFYGEKCVLRLLPQTTQSHTPESLGFTAADGTLITQAISANHGMILVAGPTGSGKTTTLYSFLRKISSGDVSLVTLEDPVEYALPEITQIPIHAHAQLTFATALRSVLRQDPDVIMVGEIRDGPTAELSVHAALTGHLLLSTLHTNDAVTAIPRLIDLGVEPFLIASTLRAVVSQRLVRKICPACRTGRKAATSEVEFLNKSKEKIDTANVTLHYGRGCGECRKTGYSGRTVISEIIVPTDGFRELVVARAPAQELFARAIFDGTTPLFDGAVRKVLDGTTTIEEVAVSCS